ncbi:hypothetical protein IV203_003844 [Nitzschia inconspicua]|uniref:Uncharacterized protein n=1 Tax=Nitzschia inconspicua TaxID=303405 RepID=A0A9K3L2L1_9STRA|nr:hypothetical protein IV203_003844 [Nitzschia inconspicua]
MRIHFIWFLSKHELTGSVFPVVLLPLETLNYIFACYAAHLGSGHTLSRRTVRSDTIRNYLLAAATLVQLFHPHNLDPRKEKGAPSLCPAIDKVLKELKRWENIPDRRHNGNSGAELTIHHPTISPKICNKWITVDTIIDAIRAAAVIDASMGMNARLLGTLLPKIPKYESIDRFDGSNLSGFFQAKYSKQSYYIILPPVEQLLEQGKKGSPVQRRATYIVNPQNMKSDSHERQQDSGHVSKSDSHERQQDSDHVFMPRQQSVSGTFWDSQRPTSFSGQDRLIRIVFQPLRDASNYFREHNNLKAGGIWSTDEIQIMLVRTMTN